MLTKFPAGVMDDPFHPLSQGCVCHLLMNEGTGNLTYDVSGHRNHGILVNLMLPNVQGSGWGANKFGGGLGFDGSNDYVDCGNNASLFITDAITIAAWVNPNPLSDYYTIVSKGSGDTSANYLFRIYHPGDYIQFVFWNAGLKYLNDDTTTIPTNVWSHIAATYDRQYIRLYVDGIEVKSGVQTAAMTADSDNVLLGKSTDALQFLNGFMDDVKIYNRALDVGEIKQLYHDPLCNLVQVPAWQSYIPAVGLSIPVAMHHYEMLRA